MQLNRANIEKLEQIILTHLDPDHIEGIRVVEQLTLDYRTWLAYPDKTVKLLLPLSLKDRIMGVRSAYGPLIDYYQTQGFVRCVYFQDTVELGNIRITALPVDRGEQTAFVYVFENGARKIVYAPCDIRPFPENREEARNPDLLVIQPGIFETGLKHGFTYPPDHISRITLYTFEETMNLAERIGAKRIVFMHLEEYWNRSYDDYRSLAAKYENITFAYDGQKFAVEDR